MKPNIPTINELWQKFAIATMPASAGPYQRREMKRAFFAGAHSLFCTLANDTTQLSDDDADKAMKSFGKQFEGFAEAIKLGEA